MTQIRYDLIEQGYDFWIGADNQLFALVNGDHDWRATGLYVTHIDSLASSERLAQELDHANSRNKELNDKLAVVERKLRNLTMHKDKDKS